MTVPCTISESLSKKSSINKISDGEVLKDKSLSQEKILKSEERNFRTKSTRGEAKEEDEVNYESMLEEIHYKCNYEIEEKELHAGEGNQNIDYYEEIPVKAKILQKAKVKDKIPVTKQGRNKVRKNGTAKKENKTANAVKKIMNKTWRP